MSPGGVEDVCKHRGQLISSMLQGGGGDRVRAGCLLGVLLFEEPVNVSLQNIERCHWRGEVLGWVVQRHEPLMGWGMGGSWSGAG